MVSCKAAMVEDTDSLAADLVFSTLCALNFFAGRVIGNLPTWLMTALSVGLLEFAGLTGHRDLRVVIEDRDRDTAEKSKPRDMTVAKGFRRLIRAYNSTRFIPPPFAPIAKGYR